MHDLQKSLADQEFITRTHSLNSVIIWTNCINRLNLEGFGNVFTRFRKDFIRITRWAILSVLNCSHELSR